MAQPESAQETQARPVGFEALDPCETLAAPCPDADTPKIGRRCYVGMRDREVKAELGITGRPMKMDWQRVRLVLVAVLI